MSLSEFSDTKEDPHIYVCEDDIDKELIAIQVFSGDLRTNLTIDANRLARLRDMFNDALDELDSQRKCPACGYTLEDAKTHGDHRICRLFPFFQWERPTLPESEAVNR